jgi:ketosteroid isomerase-like protein
VSRPAQTHSRISPTGVAQSDRLDGTQDFESGRGAIHRIFGFPSAGSTDPDGQTKRSLLSSIFPMLTRLAAAAILSFTTIAGSTGATRDSSDVETIKTLDTRYQKAVEQGDAKTMAELLGDDFTLVTGRGSVHDKAALLKSETSGDIRYEIQSDSGQTVRMLGPNTAVITAMLHMKGTLRGKPFDDHLWFTDTYVRTAAGWKYVFGQASLPLPK